MVDATTGQTAGSDLMFGGNGDDEMYGQFDDTRVPTGCTGLTCESTTQCENAVDDDGDGVINDGCSFSLPVDPPESGANCNDAADNDGDGAINDGCPTIGDEMHGGDGEDAIAGDQGNFEDSVMPVGSNEPFALQEPFIDDNRYVDNTLFRQFRFYHEGDLLPELDRAAQITTGGYDRIRGGDNADWIHAGAGSDLVNGDEGNDRLFGDNGDDTMWGGRHHDHLWGGFNRDHLDVHPVVHEPDAATCVKPPAPEVPTPDPSELYTFGFADGDTTCDGNLEHVDYIYGGWD